MKILLCNEAFIGDLILSTSVLAPLKKAFPGCHIGFLVGSWAKTVVEDHIHVDKVHVYDQAIFNRSCISRIQKKRIEKATKKHVLKEIQNMGYDIALDLHSYYKENSSHFLYKTGIPERVAYWRTKPTYFYTRPLFWECRLFHMLENHQIMLEQWGIDHKFLENFQPCLEYRSKIAEDHLKELPKEYFIVHVGTGEWAREWEVTSWIELSKKLEVFGYPLVFIGKGRREKERVTSIISHLSNAWDFSDRYSWKELIPVVRKAKFLVGLESMAGHLAAYCGIPALLIYAGESLVNWRPYHPYCQVIKPSEAYWRELEKILPKMPIHMISPDEVFEKVKKILGAHQLI